MSKVNPFGPVRQVGSAIVSATNGRAILHGFAVPGHEQFMRYAVEAINNYERVCRRLADIENELEATFARLKELP